MQGHISGQGRVKYSALIIVLILLSVFAAALSMAFGAVEVEIPTVFGIILHNISGGRLFEETWEASTATIIWNIRFPRVLMAWVVGAGLSVCGVLMQALTKNSLADPYVLGISSGASAGAVLGIMTGCFNFMGSASTMFGAILGAALSIVISLKTASYKGQITSTQLVLAGIATSAFFTGITNFLIYGYHTGSDRMKTAMYWMVGSLSGASWSDLKLLAAVFAVTIIVIMLFARELDLLLLGDSVAESLGVNTRNVKLLVILMSTVLAGITVSVSGVIGFIGLVVPHVMRRFTGSKHIRLIPAAILGGGLFTMLADLFSRVVFDPEELPIGVICSLVGAPFFLYLIRQGRRTQR